MTHKRAGILTFHRALNYGAVLQCYALMKFLEAQGFEVSVIDYRQPCIERQHGFRILFKPRYFLRKCMKLQPFAYFQEVCGVLENLKVFNSFCKKRMKQSIICKRANQIPQDFDLYVIGSDQLWNVNLTNGLDDVYCGYFPHKADAKVITYAVSSNAKSIKTQALALKDAAKNFDQISIREQSLAELFTNETGCTSRCDLDPTLVADPSIWDDLTNNYFASRDYVVVYEVRKKRGFESALFDRAYSIAKKNGWEVITISSVWRQDKMIPVEDFLSVFKFAKCVLTSSFHGTAMSLIFRRPFVAFALNDGADDRYVSLLVSLGLQDCIKNIEEDVDEVPVVDFSKADEKWSELRRSAEEYLKSYL